MKTCKNCGNDVNSTYCGHCGQKAVPERITFHYIWHEFVHFFTHAEKGFFYTTKNLIANPGGVVTDFIEGKRKNYQKPLSYYLIWISLYSLLLFGLEKLFGENRVVSFSNYFGPGEKTKFAISHLNIVLTLLLPVQAVYLYLILMQRRYNFFEALVATLYAVGTVIFLQIVFVLMVLIYFLFTGYAVSISWSDILKAAYIIWFLVDFARELPVKAKYARAISVMLLLMGTFTAWRLYVSPTFANLFFR